MTNLLKSNPYPILLKISYFDRRFFNKKPVPSIDAGSVQFSSTSSPYTGKGLAAVCPVPTHFATAQYRNISKIQKY